MEVIPAIDVRDGRCVRLFQGDYDRETVFSDDPAEVAARWAGLGAPRLHVVDLDGARSGEPKNLNVVGKIAAAVDVPIQVGGGVRSLETARRVMAAGADRVILGTAAVENRELAHEACARLGPDAVIVAVDARGEYAAVRGWTQTSETKAADLIDALAQAGARRFMYTDVARDGTLTEPNFSAIQALVSQAPSLLAAGGVSSLDHLEQLAAMGVEGAIVGKAAHTGDVNLREAFQSLSQDR